MTAPLSSRAPLEPPYTSATSGTDRELRGVVGWVVRRRLWVIGGWLIVLALLAPSAARVDQTLDVSAQVEGSESALVDSLLRTRFDSPFARYLVLVISGAPAPSTPQGGAVLRTTTRAVTSVPGVAGVVSWLDANDSAFVSASHGGTFIIV